MHIVEQILPYFQPAYNLTIELVEQIKEKKDIPIVLENITTQDDYDGDFTSRRVLLYTLRFTAKTYLFGPVTSASKDIIKKATVNYIAGRDASSAARDVTYSVSPRAIKDYNGDFVTNISDDINMSAKTIVVDDSSGLTAKTYVDLEGEELYIKTINGNKITVERGKDDTTITSHLKGAPIKLITKEDNQLVEIGDDFGFDGDLF